MATPIAICGECGKVALPVNGSVIYPHRPEFHEKLYYRCECGAYCGSHERTGMPFGKPAGPATRKARSAAHRAFDRIWQGKLMSRTAAYAWLARSLGVDPFHCHIGSFDAATCDRVTRIANEYWEGLDATQVAAARAAQAESRSPAYDGRKETLGRRRQKAMRRLRETARDRSSRDRKG